MQESIVFLVRVQNCRRKESSRSLSHLLVSFLLVVGIKTHAKTRLVNEART